MIMTMEDDIKRWTAKRKATLVMEIIQGKTTIAEVFRVFDFSSSDIEEWVDESKRGMENALRAKPLDIKEQYERQLKELQEAVRWSDAVDTCSKKVPGPAGQRGREMILSIQQSLHSEGVTVTMSQLRRWFELPRRTAYCKPCKAPLPRCRSSLKLPSKQ